MSLLWILAGIVPGGILYLIYRSEKKHNTNAKIFKDFWVCLFSWLAAGVLASGHALFGYTTMDSMSVYLIIGIGSQFVGTLLIMEKNKKK